MDQTGSETAEVYSLEFQESLGLSVMVASIPDSGGGRGSALIFAGKHRTLSGDAIDLDRLDRPWLERGTSKRVEHCCH